MQTSRFASLALALLVAFLLAAPDADARTRQTRARKSAPTSGHVERSVTRTGPDGSSRTSSHESTWQRGDGQWSRDSVHTGPNGGVTTRNAAGAYDPETKTWTREKVVTRPDGSSVTTDVTKQITPVVQEPAPTE